MKSLRYYVLNANKLSTLTCLSLNQRKLRNKKKSRLKPRLAPNVELSSNLLLKRWKSPMKISSSKLQKSRNRIYKHNSRS